MKLVMELPTKDSPGFLKRSRQATSFAVRLRSKDVGETIFDEMVEFLLPFVKEPVDRDEAREALWNASQAQFEQALTAIGGGGESTVNPPSG